MKHASAVLLFALLFAVTGCDWLPYAFLNTIPFHGDPKKNPDVYVYIGMDGVAERTAREVMAKGHFPGFHLARHITNFPGTSDASWTRITHTEKMSGYEFEYYHPGKDTVVRKGISGQVLHLIPSIGPAVDFEFPYLKSFDFHANNYTHQMNAYGDSWTSVGDTFDNIFYLLEGRAETKNAFSAYVLETDPMGHMKTPEDVADALTSMSIKIERFKAAHPERRFHFTILSDHGMDFVRVPGDNLIVFADEMKKIGVQEVNRLNGHDPSKELYAIPIMHTRVSYIALHTHPTLVEEIAKRSSTLESVDLTVGRVLNAPEGAPSASEWFGVWAEGKRVLVYGFNKETDRYVLPASADLNRLDLEALTFAEGEEWKSFSDDELFQVTKDATYPDLFYRIRTGLSPVGVEYPADILVSFRLSYVSMGFSVFGKADIASSGFHGALHKLPTNGTILTDERELPDSVRADTFLELFPRLRDHIRSRGLSIVDGDSNASLQY